MSQLRFNEAYMLHASTSPFYPLFSSLDVGAQMMKGRNGFHLWNDATRLAVEMRKSIRRLLRRSRRRQATARRRPGSSIRSSRTWSP